MLEARKVWENTRKDNLYQYFTIHYLRLKTPKWSFIPVDNRSFNTLIWTVSTLKKKIIQPCAWLPETDKFSDRQSPPTDSHVTVPGLNLLILSRSQRKKKRTGSATLFNTERRLFSVPLKVFQKGHFIRFIFVIKVFLQCNCKIS